jgi:saccharopine dehydrogenase-like NADP-dependent oxidoreductase
MKKIVVLGAGLVSKPLVKYLLGVEDFFVTLGDMDVEKASGILGNAANAKAVPLEAGDRYQIETLIKANDLAISLLPFGFHPTVAEFCIRHKKHMVTASYVSDQMKGMDKEAKAAGITILNEIGVDPGIDHMSAMRIIDSVHDREGKIEEFYSYCGGLPAPDANDNPFGYKFSWSPQGVLKAGTNDARYLKDGKVVEIEGKNLFFNRTGLALGGFDGLETYPNRDALPYVDIYGIPETKTMFRGTIRNHGWCDKLLALAKLGLLEDECVDLPESATFLDLICKMTGIDPSGNHVDNTGAFLGEKFDASVLSGLKWLGLFDTAKLPETRNILDIMTETFFKKMRYKSGERDMIILHHDFVAKFPQGKKRIASTLIEYGIENGDSAMARTVGLPAAIGAELVLKGKINLPGVQIPVKPEIYMPVLKKLEALQIRCLEKESSLAPSLLCAPVAGRKPLGR